MTGFHWFDIDGNHEDVEGDQQHRLHRGECPEEEHGEGGEGEQEEGQLLQGRQPERQLGQEREQAREFDPWIRIRGDLAREAKEKSQVCGRSVFQLKSKAAQGPLNGF